ncbi:MAG TPA: ATP-binding cassette domain-containing protein [Bacteroidia bacterium]|jgi:ABC-2 type transport system ATP-binding protein|nr:ATP-binding cassette domain-containing protein [Bacteroidia bacterium]
MEVVVKNLTKRYKGFKAVDNISFRVNQGEVLGFLGPNGAGKSTTMKVITSYIAPSEGDVEVGGYSVITHPEEVKKLIGYLPENNPLYLDMPIMDYLEFSARLQGVPKEKVNQRVREMIKVCGLSGEKHKLIAELSKGYRQRVGLAHAMIHDPQVLILDEPTSGLDPNQIIEIRKLIKDIGKQKTVILSTHILPEVEATCDRILIINKGHIVADGTPETLRKQAKGREIIRVKIEDGKEAEISAALKSLTSVLGVENISGRENTFEVQADKFAAPKRDIYKMCVDKGWVLTEMVPYETSLEDIFHDLTIN